MKGSSLKSAEQPSETIEAIKTPFRVGGVEPFSALNYPNHLSAVIFCQGCPWRCRYCHNAHLQSFLPSKESKYEWEAILDFLESRKNQIDGVVFSGGEPLSQPRLIDAIHDVKSKGFKVALHTGGSSARTFSEVLPHVDWVGLDMKAPLEKYPEITGISKSGVYPWECVRLLVESGVPYECRTTVHPLLLSGQDVWEMAQKLHQMGVRYYAIQYFQEKGCVDEKLVQEKFRLPLEEEFCNKLRGLFDSFIIR